MTGFSAPCQEVPHKEPVPGLSKRSVCNAASPILVRWGRPAPLNDNPADSRITSDQAGRSKQPRCKAVCVGPSEAYSRYAAASARANQRRRWVVFSGLLQAITTVYHQVAPRREVRGI